MRIEHGGAAFGHGTRRLADLLGSFRHLAPISRQEPLTRLADLTMRIEDGELAS